MTMECMGCMCIVQYLHTMDVVEGSRRWVVQEGSTARLGEYQPNKCCRAQAGRRVCLAIESGQVLA